jgi:DNA sulfur modification protein DndD
MIIKSIQLSNFGCYKGTHSPITFSTDKDKNVTVILGDNKSGKTTLVRAFLWCLYNDDSRKNEIINNEARAEIITSVKCMVFVEVILIHSGKEYTIRRTQEFSKFNERIKSNEPILKVYYKQANGEQEPITKDCDDTVNSILPKGLSDYFFYEGERFDDISKKDVATAVKGLMGLDAISEARKQLDPNRSTSATSRFKKRLISDNIQESDRLNQSLTEKQNEREKIIQQIENAKIEYDFYLRRKDELTEKLSQNANVKSLHSTRQTLESDIKIIQSNIEQIAKRTLSDFQRGALAFFALPLINRALIVIDGSKQNSEGIPAMRQEAIDHILGRERCICGCDLMENEGARKHILAERNLLPPEYLGTHVYYHKQTLLGYQSSSESFVEETNSNYSDWRRNINFLGEKNDDIEKVSTEIASTGSMDIERIEIDYQETVKKLDELAKLREKLPEKKGATECDIKNIEKKIASHIEKTDINNKIQRYINYAKALFNMFDTMYSQREQEVKADLAKSVNHIFSEMYRGHRIVSIDDNYQIKLLALVGLSQEEIAETGGVRAVKNFAYITGLVDIARKRALQGNEKKETSEDIVSETEPYPLVMDAPFSGIDEKHIDNVSRLVPEIAEQVIIMSMQKDWFYARSSIEARVGKRYVIENIDNSEICSKIREGE